MIALLMLLVFAIGLIVALFGGVIVSAADGCFEAIVGVVICLMGIGVMVAAASTFPDFPKLEDLAKQAAVQMYGPNAVIQSSEKGTYIVLHLIVGDQPITMYCSQPVSKDSCSSTVPAAVPTVAPTPTQMAPDKAQ